MLREHGGSAAVNARLTLAPTRSRRLGRPRLARRSSCVMEALIQFGAINRYIVPPPSEICRASSRVIVEEHIAAAFC